MALRPGYLALLDAARCCGLTEFTREDAIALEDQMRDCGWVIAPAWLVGAAKGVVADSEISDEEVIPPSKLMTVFTHPSGADQVEAVFTEVRDDFAFQWLPSLEWIRADRGSFCLCAPSLILDEVERRLRAITGVICRR